MRIAPAARPIAALAATAPQNFTKPDFDWGGLAMKCLLA
jgi:hypothetical protein